MRRGVFLGCALSCFLAFGWASIAAAQSSGSSQDLSEYVESQLMEPEEAYPWVEHHGYFRFRGDLFWNLDLDTRGTSPILPPLESREGSFPTPEDDEEQSELFDSGAELLASANIRFRYHPIFHVTEGARIHLEADILDNLVLGSTPDGFGVVGGDPVSNRPDVPLAAFTPGAQPMNGDLTFRDSIRIRQAYAEMEFLGLIRVGRMASNWGLGILANHGGSYSASPLQPRTSYRGTELGGFNCVDCDYGDVVDRFLFVTRVLPTVYVGFMFDWQNQGTADYRADQPLGQARDMSEVDDVFEVVFTAFRSYYTEREQRERARLMTELNEPIIEGGIYFIIRNQDGEQGAGGFLPNDFENPIFPRLADALIPDIWVRLQWEPAFRQRIRLELEAVAVFGEIENVLDNLPDPDDPGAASRDIQQFGVAFESDFRWNDLTTGLNAGFASGRETGSTTAADAPGFGVLDVNTVNPDTNADRDVSNFIFDRDYFVDMIMFREIIGAITNAIYFNPFVQYNFFTAQASAMGARLDFIFALAHNPDVTPGGERWIGFETDITVYYQSDTYRADLAYGLFVPGNAFDGRAGRARIPSIADFWDLDPTYDENVDANLAHTLQFKLTWAF